MLPMETLSESLVSVSCVLLFLAVTIEAVKYSPRDGISLVSMPSPDVGGRMELLSAPVGPDAWTPKMWLQAASVWQPFTP